MENLKNKTADFRKEIIGDKKYLSELSTEEIYSLVQYIVAVEYSRSANISRIMSQDDLVQDIMVELYRDHDTETMKALKLNLKTYIEQNMTVSHFINTMFLSAKQYIIIYCTRQKSTTHILQDASLDAELDDEKSNLYNVVSSRKDLNLDVEDILRRLPDVGNKKFYIRFVQADGTVKELKYTYKNLMRLYIYLYNRNEEKKIRNYIYETETKKRVVNIEKVLAGFKLCLQEYEVLSAM